MGPSLEAVTGKARAFVESLARLPQTSQSTIPNGHFARDYNTLRLLALEACADRDERLFGKYIEVYDSPSGELSQASYVEIETYARQIMEQLTLLQASVPTKSEPTNTRTVSKEPAKTYDVQEIRREHSQAYGPWSEQDDEYLRTRFAEGASLEGLVSEFSRQPGGIRSRLHKLGLDFSRRPTTQTSNRPTS